MGRRWKPPASEGGAGTRRIRRWWGRPQSHHAYVVMKTATIRLGGVSAEALTDAGVSTLENYSFRRQSEALYRSANERHITDLIEHITTALIDGGAPTGFQKHVRGNLKYTPYWKEDPDRVIEELGTRGNIRWWRSQRGTMRIKETQSPVASQPTSRNLGLRAGKVSKSPEEPHRLLWV